MKKLILGLIILAIGSVAYGRTLTKLIDAAGNTAFEVTTDDAGTSTVTADNFAGASASASTTIGTVTVQTNATSPAATVGILTVQTQINAAAISATGALTANSASITGAFSAAATTLSGALESDSAANIGGAATFSNTVSALDAVTVRTNLVLNSFTETTAGATVVLTNAPASTTGVTWVEFTIDSRVHYVPMLPINN